LSGALGPNRFDEFPSFVLSSCRSPDSLDLFATKCWFFFCFLRPHCRSDFFLQIIPLSLLPFSVAFARPMNFFLVFFLSYSAEGFTSSFVLRCVCRVAGVCVFAAFPPLFFEILKEPAVVAALLLFSLLPLLFFLEFPRPPFFFLSTR